METIIQYRLEDAQVRMEAFASILHVSRSTAYRIARRTSSQEPGAFAIASLLQHAHRNLNYFEAAAAELNKGPNSHYAIDRALRYAWAYCETTIMIEAYNTDTPSPARVMFDIWDARHKVAHAILDSKIGG